MAEQKPIRFKRLAANLKPKGRAVQPAAREAVKEVLGDSPLDKAFLIENLHRIQDSNGALSFDNLAALAEAMNLPMAAVYEVATFYHHFDVVGENEENPPPITVRVCESLSCEMAGGAELLKALAASAGTNVRVKGAPCIGRCAGAPAAVVGQNALENATVESLTAAVAAFHTAADIPPAETFAKYRKNGGYEIFQRCLSGEINVDGVIAELDSSGLRGLGGAGFPVGRKWNIVRGQQGEKILAVNIDEGEPGTFKDRYYLERQPHCFLEGALIAAWAVSAADVYIYLRDEYHGCRLMLEREVAVLRADSGFALPNLYLRRGAGAYICGEESAMIESIEGKRGEPRLRPPYVAEVGVFGRPTLEHNMETLHWIPTILAKGGEWFAPKGRRGRLGLRSFSVSGRVKNPGVHVAPAGITVAELIEEYCGGMIEGHQFYGYLPGGASGGILPATMDDVPLDFDTVQARDGDCFIGSAAVIILSHKDRARDAALNMMKFFEDESCGQCTPCRVGTAKAVQLMEAPVWDKNLLEELSAAMADASICGLGQAAPNPIRCVLKHFSDEVV